MKVVVILMLLADFFPFPVLAQIEKFENLSIDRPDISNLPVTIRPGHYQFELGTEIGKFPGSREMNIPNLVFRTGLNRSSELRLGFNFLYADSVLNGGNANVMFLSVGGKYRFVQEDGWRPAIAVQPEVSLRFGEHGYTHRNEANYLLDDFSLIVLFNNTLHKNIFVNYNIGVFWNRNDKADGLLSVSTSFLHTHRLGYFLEIYSLIEDTGLPLSYDAGIMFLVSPRFQLDVYLGNREFEGWRSWYGGAGVGFRLDKGDLKPKTFPEIGIHK